MGLASVSWETWTFIATAVIALFARSIHLWKRVLPEWKVAKKAGLAPIARLLRGHARIGFALCADSLGLLTIGLLSVLIVLDPSKSLVDWIGWFVYAYFIGFQILITILTIVDLRTPRAVE